MKIVDKLPTPTKRASYKQAGRPPIDFRRLLRLLPQNGKWVQLTEAEFRKVVPTKLKDLRYVTVLTRCRKATFQLAYRRDINGLEFLYARHI